MDFLTETEKNENMCDDQRYTSVFLFLMKEYLIYNVVLVLGVQKSDSVIHI